MSHDTDTDTDTNPNPNPTPLGERSERIQRLRQALRHPKILAADGWYTQEDDRIAPTDREYIAACDPATISELLSELDELWRIAGAYRPQKELADAVNRLNAEQAQRITLQHHAADLAQRVADLTAERDHLAARLDRQAEALCSELKEAHGALRRARDELAARPTKAQEFTLNAAQLRHALEFVAPDFDADPDQRVAEVTIAWRDAGVVTDDDGNPEPAGYVAWITDYPEEGALPLSESWDVMPAAAPAQAEIEGSPLLALVARAEALSRMARAATADGCGACVDDCKPRGSCRLADESPQAELTRCQADCDGDCSHPDCPQRRDGEPHATGRICPLGAEGGAA